MKTYRYVWTVLTGWALVAVCAWLNNAAALWLGGVLGVVLGIASIVLSVYEMSKGIKHVVIHGIAWTLAVALVFMCVMWMYAVSSGT